MISQEGAFQPMKLEPTTQRTLQDALRSLDLSGQAVCVHSSLRSFGWVEGGAKSIIAAFLVEGCTLLVPTYSYSYAVAPTPALQVPRNGWTYSDFSGPLTGEDRIYTVESREIDDDMGAIPTAVLAMPNRVRGDNPLNSFSAVGPLAEQLIAPQKALAVYAPLRMLAEVGGVVLLMGVTLEKMTLLHYAEERAGRVPFRRWANDSGGIPQMVEAGSCSDGFEHFTSILQPWHREKVVGNSLWHLYPAAQTLEAAAAAIRADPHLTHCGRADCERCRDAELGGPILR